MAKKSSFFDKFKNKINKMDNVINEPVTPRWGLTSGNYTLNRILCGTYGFGKLKGPFMQGKMSMFAGFSGVGKSFITSTGVKSALENGFYVVYMDTENATDSLYLKKIGVDANSENFVYYGVETINSVAKIVSQFVAQYKEEYSENLEEAPNVLMVIDSLSYLNTDSEHDDFMGGEIKGDQGQSSKQTGKLLKQIQQVIKSLNITVITTNHVYENPNIMNGKGQYLMSEKIKYPHTFIGLLNKKALRENGKASSKTLGFIMKANSYKSRMNVLGASAEIEIPWDTGMSPFSGLVDVLKADGLIKDHNNLNYVVVATGEIIRKDTFLTSMTDEKLKEICYDYDNNVETTDETFGDISDESSNDNSGEINKTNNDEIIVSESSENTDVVVEEE